MRRLLFLFGICALLLSTGCNQISRWRLFNKGPDAPLPTEMQPPTAEQLVSYLNQNSERLKTLQCDYMTLTASQGLGVIRSITLEADLRCQQPRNFRLLARTPGSGGTAVDLGSNKEEFWFWIKEIGAEKKTSPLFHCSYDALEKGDVRIMPLPFQPNWILETMCMSDFGPATRYQLKVEKTKLKLIERTKSPQGKPVLKVIVFNRRPVKEPTPQIEQFILVDETTKREICSARIPESQAVKGALLPRKLEIRWPEHDMKLTMNITNPEVGTHFPEGHPMFARRPIAGHPSIDMASGRYDHLPSSIQRVQGFGMRPK